MRRREFIAGLGGAVAWPVVARGEESVPLVGFLNTQSPKGFARYVAAFRQGLQETGFVEGKNVAIEYRWGEGDYGRLPALVAQLLERRPAACCVSRGLFVAVHRSGCGT
jgi:putative tryptophan/tyrosine transport system substrate-binding protein